MWQFAQMRPWLIALLVLAGCGQSQAPAPPLTAKAVLDKAYPEYDKKHACWIADDPDGGRYCMKLDSEKTIKLKQGERLYVIASGEIVDEHGEPNGAHVNMGLVGAFIVETLAGKAPTIVSNPFIGAGSYGRGPTGWQLVKLGADDYWGWLNTWGDCHQGYCGSYYDLLAPRGLSIVNVSNITADYDDSGACAGFTTDDEGNEVEINCDDVATKLQTKLVIDGKKPDVKVYPLRVTVTGQDHGKKLNPKTWVIPFDTQHWRYNAPADYPLRDKDF